MGTRREQMIQHLQAAPRSASELAGLMKMRVKDVVDDLEHVRRSLGNALTIEQARCVGCGFVFRAGRISAPSRCPKCRGEHVIGPYLSVTRR
jgi:hypothetical protein